MGRFTTRLATTFAAADNVAYEDKMKNVSVLDALTSKRMVKWLLPEAQKTKDDTAAQKHDRLFKVKTDSRGRKVLVIHKGKAAEAKAEDTKADKDKNNDKKKDDAKAETKKDEKKDDPAQDANRGKDWTTEDDEKLKAMKAENKTWKEIQAALNRGKSDCQARFKELNAQTSGNAKDGKNDAGVAKQQADDKKADDKQGKQKGKQDKNENKKNDKASSSDGEEARFTMAEWKSLQEDNMFSLSELQCLSELLDEHGTESWLAIASGFFDITGRRVSPDDIRDKFEQMSAMGTQK